MPKKTLAVFFLLVLVLYIRNLSKETDICSLINRGFIPSSAFRPTSTWQRSHLSTNMARTTDFQSTEESDRLQLIRLKEQLMYLSNESNFRQEKHQQLVCNTQLQLGSTETGAYCGYEAQSWRAIDVRLAQWLSLLFNNQSVVGLGDGLGEYRRIVLESGRVRVYDAFDGTPNISEITSGKVRFLDLTLPQYWLPKYDWVVCLEVAEHIPEIYTDILLDNIARLSKHGVVLSWAKPGQNGFLHINTRPDSYVQSAMLRRGFSRDVEQSERMRRFVTLGWLKENAYIYRRAV